MSDPGDMLRLDDCVPIEKYTLILKHEYINKNGKYLIDDPLVVSSVASMQYGMSVIPVNVQIQMLTEKMKHEAVRAYGGEKCEK